MSVLCFCAFAVLFALCIGLERVDNDRQTEHDQQDCEDELETVCDEYRAPGGLACRNRRRGRRRDRLYHRKQALHQSGEGDAQHDDQRREYHLVAAAGDSEEYAQRDEHQSAQQLVCRTEQRPDVGVADLGQHIAERKGKDGREIDVAEQLPPALCMLHVIDREQLLKAHTADTGNCVQAGQRQSGNAHGHEYSRDIDRNTEHFEEARNAAAEYLERRASRRGAVCCGSRTGNAQRENCQQAFQHHGAVADLRHILFILDGLGGRTGGNQTVEAGNRAARNRDEQDREQRAELFVGEAGEYRQVHGRMRNDQTDDRTGDHADEHEGRHVVARLLEQPHREDCCEEDVDEGDVAPCRLAEDQRAVRADDKGQDDEHDAENGFLPALEGKLLLDKAEYNGEHHKHDRDHAGSTVGLSRRRQLHDACVAGREGVERTGYHISKRRDDDAAEDPREYEEQLAAGSADILLDQHAHRLALVLDRGVQRTEVRDRAEEYAADQHPE